uniref:Uncharacterized protein n=1 Tax=Aegilops tauschii subsp. strangulata TaxID=200361 RepID=A0A453CU62_AEGTS
MVITVVVQIQQKYFNRINQDSGRISVSNLVRYKIQNLVEWCYLLVCSNMLQLTFLSWSGCPMKHHPPDHQSVVGDNEFANGVAGNVQDFILNPMLISYLLCESQNWPYSHSQRPILTFRKVKETRREFLLMT